MKPRNHRLVLGCIILAIELVRLATKIVALGGAAINYVYERKVVHSIRAQAR